MANNRRCIACNKFSSLPFSLRNLQRNNVFFFAFFGQNRVWFFVNTQGSFVIIVNVNILLFWTDINLGHQIKLFPNAREVVALYQMDDTKLELSMVLPVNHPLGPVTVEPGQHAGGAANWRNCHMQLSIFLTHQVSNFFDCNSKFHTSFSKSIENVCALPFSHSFPPTDTKKRVSLEAHAWHLQDTQTLHRNKHFHSLFSVITIEMFLSSC